MRHIRGRVLFEKALSLVLLREGTNFDPSPSGKFWSSFFKSSWGSKGQSPLSSSAELETPKTSDKVPLFGSLEFRKKFTPR